MITHGIRPLIANHWFLVVAPIVVLVSALAAISGPITRLVEIGLLFDLVILLPALYVLCYGKRKSSSAIRAIGLASLGVWVATRLIPEADRVILVYIEPLRYVGLVVLFLLEIAVVRLIFVSLSAGDNEAAAAQKATDASEMPTWAARLLAWEAGLWRRLFVSARRFFRRDRDDA